MSVLVYVQYHRPFKKHKDQSYTIQSHADHMGYIATRPRTYMNLGENHGLMGNIDGEGLCDIPYVWRAKKAVMEAAGEKRNIYRSVVSMTRETADEKGLTDKDAWKEFAARQARIIADANGIKLENFRYACAAHNEGGHPHLHFMFWDAGKYVVQKPCMNHSKIGTKIRISMIKSEFADELNEYKDQKKLGIDSISQISVDSLDAFEHEIVSIKPDKLQKLLQMDGVSDSYKPEVPKLAADLYRITGLMPKRGSIAYSKQPPEVRTAVDNLVADMMDNSPALKAAVSKYIDACMGMVGLYTSDSRAATADKNEDIISGIRDALKECTEKQYTDCKAAFETVTANHGTDATLRLLAFYINANGRTDEEYRDWARGVVDSMTPEEIEGFTKDGQPIFFDALDKWPDAVINGLASVASKRQTQREKLAEKRNGYKEDAYKKIAAKILKAVKQLNIELTRMERDRDQLSQQLEEFAGDVFLEILRKLDMDTRIAAVSPRTVIGGELSAQAKKEKALESRDKGWEM